MGPEPRKKKQFLKLLERLTGARIIDPPVYPHMLDAFAIRHGGVGLNSVIEM
jgi:hypothetical protein